MAVHRYWKFAPAFLANGYELDLHGAYLLLVSTRADSGSTLTSNIAPSTGSLANLADSDITTGATWADARSLILTWDLGSAQDINNIQLVGGAAPDKFPVSGVLSWSDDNSTWSSFNEFVGNKWPGKNVATSDTNRRVTSVKAVIQLTMDGANNATAVTDQLGKNWTFFGNAKLSTASPKSGTAALTLDGAGDYISTSDNLNDIAFGSEDFTVEAWLKMAASNEMIVIDYYLTSDSTGSNWELGINGGSNTVYWYLGPSRSAAAPTTTSRSVAAAAPCVCISTACWTPPLRIPGSIPWVPRTFSVSAARFGPGTPATTLPA